MQVLIALTGLFLTAGQAAPEQRMCEVNQAANPEQSFEDQLAGAACVMRLRGMSEKGITTVVAGMRSEQRQQWAIFERTSEKLQALRKSAETDPFDPNTFEQGLREYKNTQASAYSAATEAEIAVFRTLSPADQRIYARLMHGTEGGVRLGMPVRPMLDSR
jgi:hypothetical protein